MKIRNILLGLTVLFAFNACSDDTDPVLVMPETPNTMEPTGVSTLVIDKTNIDDEALTFEWIGDKPELSVVTQYAVQFDVAGNNFANGQVLGISAESPYTVTATVLNDFLTKKLGQEAFTAVEYEYRIVSAAVGKDGIYTLYPQTASASQKITVTTYQSAPENIYMIGEEFGNWTWSDPGIVTMIPVNGKAGEFWAVRYISAGKGFKWSPNKEFKGDFSKLGDATNGYILVDGNAQVAADGMYMIYIDYLNEKITIEPAGVYGMGGCFGGWEAQAYPFAVSGKKMTRTTTAEDNLRIYAWTAASSAGGDWWRMEFILRDGVIEYRGNGGDQASVSVAAGKTITLDFNAGTGTIN